MTPIRVMRLGDWLQVWIHTSYSNHLLIIVCACSQFWPLGNGLTEGYHLDCVPHAWLDFLKDTRSNACFAVLSRNCLTYHARDDLSKRHIRKICSLSPGGSRSQPLLETLINLNTETDANRQPAAKARLRLQDGFLEIRNGSSARLAFYERFSLINRMEELAIVTRDGQKGHQHKELVTPQRASSSVVPVCIMDRQKR